MASASGSFVSGVRDQLVLHAGATRHLELVLLPPQAEDPRKAPWFGVTLRAAGAAPHTRRQHLPLRLPELGRPVVRVPRLFAHRRRDAALVRR
ncbi:Heterogeneous nuclear ribonucleoprotein 27C [Hordeum vulgare]|nr:Heterogeneous nuclear ribonucleoprotein 27C [Hordeum vulgare]